MCHERHETQIQKINHVCHKMTDVFTTARLTPKLHVQVKAFKTNAAETPFCTIAPAQRQSENDHDRIVPGKTERWVEKYFFLQRCLCMLVPS